MVDQDRIVSGVHRTEFYVSISGITQLFNGSIFSPNTVSIGVTAHIGHIALIGGIAPL